MSAFTRAVGAIAFAASTLPSVSVRADEPVPPDRGTTPETFPDAPTQPNLLLIGGVVTAVWYGAAVGTSYLWSESPSAESLRIPVAGPYMALAKTGCGDREFACGTFTVVVRTVFTSLAAVGQTGGVLAMVEGAFLPTSRASEASVSSGFRVAGESGAAEVRFEPARVGDSEFGFALMGAF